MREVYIKHNNYYIQEREHTKAPYQFFRVLKPYASDMCTIELAVAFIDEINLNRAHCVIEVEDITKTTNGSYLLTTEYRACPVCNEFHAVDTFVPTIVDIETGVELYCEDCHDEADKIITNQPLDELVSYEK